MSLSKKLLILSVTGFHRGTQSERKIVVHLLKNGALASTLFHDLYVRKNTNDYAQIDLVMATSIGVIVIEVKDYGGWIYGTGTKKYWTQVMAYGKQKYRFYNPIMQNQGHIATLKANLTQNDNIPFYSVIVFTNRGKLIDIDLIPDNTFIINSYEIISLLANLLSSKPVVNYGSKVELIQLLSESAKNGNSSEIRKQHRIQLNNYNYN
ncbi:MAG: nuclease-related domain-containing protein [Prevotella sp.]|nr:nuclease-related domain-containing protein [Prevotella sp.]